MKTYVIVYINEEGHPCFKSVLARDAEDARTKAQPPYTKMIGTALLSTIRDSTDRLEHRMEEPV